MLSICWLSLSDQQHAVLRSRVCACVCTSVFLQRARSGFEQRLWRRIIAWSDDDVSIRSPSQTEHVERVRGEAYAYINDLTSFELEVSRSCDVGIVNEHFLPVEYSVALRNNSYFASRISLE